MFFVASFVFFRGSLHIKQDLELPNSRQSIHGGQLLTENAIVVEWPLGRGLAESEELAKLASAAGVRTMVGLQARAEPVVIKAKELVTSGKIGQVVSSTATLQIAIPFDLGWPKGAEYYLDMKSGGNEYFIYFGHCKYIYSPEIRGFRSMLTRIISRGLLHSCAWRLCRYQGNVEYIYDQRGSGE